MPFSCTLYWQTSDKVSCLVTLCLTMIPTYRGRHIDKYGVLMLGQATTPLQTHLTHTLPAPGGGSAPLGAEQGCKRILALVAVLSRQTPIKLIHPICLASSAHVHREALCAENRPSWRPARTASHSPISQANRKKRQLRLKSRA